jgi:monoterpene epsilon-lactone hydrolase
MWPGMIHVFQQFPAELDAARQAIASAGAFLSRHLGLTPTSAT